MKEFTYKQRPQTRKYEKGYDRIFGKKNADTRQSDRKNTKKEK